MDRIRIRGGKRLRGEIRVSGAKNAALPLMAAALLTDQPLRLANMPDLMDIATMASLLTQLGVAISVSGQIFNAAALVHRGTIAGFVPKEKLPTYNVFYEARTFSRGGPGLAIDADGVPLGDYRFQFDFGDVAVEVC